MNEDVKNKNIVIVASGIEITEALTAMIKAKMKSEDVICIRKEDFNADDAVKEGVQVHYLNMIKKPENTNIIDRIKDMTLPNIVIEDPEPFAEHIKPSMRRERQLKYSEQRYNSKYSKPSKYRR